MKAVSRLRQVAIKGVLKPHRILCSSHLNPVRCMQSSGGEQLDDIRKRIASLRQQRPPEDHFIHKIPNIIAGNSDDTLRTLLKEAKRSNDYDKVLELYAKTPNPAEFDSGTLTAVLEACERSNNPICVDIIPGLYKLFSERHTVTLYTYGLVLRAIEQHISKGQQPLLQTARKVVNDYRAAYPASDSTAEVTTSARRISSTYIQILCAARLSGAAMTELRRAQSKNMALFAETCETLIRFLASRNEIREIVQTVTYMNGALITPSAKVVDLLISVGLDNSDRWLLRQVLQFARIKARQLDYGVLSRMLSCAARTADNELAMQAIAAMEAAKYELGYADLRALILAATRGSDDASAISALMEMEKRGMQPDWEVIDSLANCLSLHMRRMDETYYALADAARVEKIPSSALQAIIMGSGKAGSLDRAFATFQEAKQVFGVEPSVPLYNALLYAASVSKYRKVTAIASIMQQMETEQLSADAKSYEFIMKTLFDNDMIDQAQQIFFHMLAKNITPTPVMLRMCAREFARQHMKDLVDIALEQLVALEGSAPRYLTKRVNQLLAQPKPSARNAESPEVIEDLDEAPEHRSEELAR